MKAPSFLPAEEPPPFRTDVNRDSTIFVAGHRGLVGSAISRRLRSAHFSNILTRRRSELDLEKPDEVESFFSGQRPEYVFLAAAKVGGILANSTKPAEFIRANLAIQSNTIDWAWRSGVSKLLFLGSSCIYPKLAPQPMREEMLMTGPLEPTNSAYAVAKIAGIEMCRAYNEQYGTNFVSAMPTNLYGPGDNFDLQSSHVVPALIRKFHEAKVNDAPTVTVWGTGTPRRELMHVDDLAEACVFLMQTYSGSELINVGTGVDVSIADLARKVADVVGFAGRIEFDASKPDGTPRKLLDVSRISSLGWQASIDLAQGLRSTYAWYLENVERTETSAALS